MDAQIDSNGMTDAEKDVVRGLAEFFRKVGLDHAGQIGVVLPPTPAIGPALDTWEGMPVFYAPVDRPSVVVIPPDPARVRNPIPEVPSD